MYIQYSVRAEYRRIFWVSTGFLTRKRAPYRNWFCIAGLKSHMKDILKKHLKIREFH